MWGVHPLGIGWREIWHENPIFCCEDYGENNPMNVSMCDSFWTTLGFPSLEVPVASLPVISNDWPRYTTIHHAGSASIAAPLKLQQQSSARSVVSDAPWQRELWSYGWVSQGIFGKIHPWKTPEKRTESNSNANIGSVDSRKMGFRCGKKGDSTLFSVRCFLTLGYRGEQDSTKKIHSRRDSWRWVW